MEQLLSRIKAALGENAYPNERAVSTSIVVPILRALGWDDADPSEVIPEYTSGRGRVDYALRTHGERPSVFIEVKGVGKSTDADEQLFAYAFHEGVPLAVLTDGREWSFYLPAQQGSYNERRLYQLALDERPVEECVARFTRYLQRERVRSGTALEDATAGYRDARSTREAEANLPRAWADLLGEPHESLVDLLLERVEVLSGFRPRAGAAAAFLQALRGTAPPERPAARSVPRTVLSNGGLHETPASASNTGVRWCLGQEEGTGRTAIDAFAAYLDAALANYPDKRTQITDALRTPSWNHLAERTEEIYGDNAKFAKFGGRKLPRSGLWLGYQMSNSRKLRFARRIAGVLNLRFGVDAILDV